MKRYLIIILFSLFLSNHLVANIMPPQAFISEIKIDSSGFWTIELGFYDSCIPHIDSLRLETSCGSSLIIQLVYLPGLGGNFGYDSLALISNSDLSNPLIINITWDYVKLYSYAFDGILLTSIDYISFGNYPGSYLIEVNPEQSIAEVQYIQSLGWCRSFCLDASPTLGLPNDTTGCLATIHGMVYDTEGSLFTEGFFPFVISTLNIHIQPDGSYSERVFARDYEEDTIAIRFPPWPYTIVTYSIIPVNPWLLPDSVVSCDFYTTSIIPSTPEYKRKRSLVVAFPNPFTTGITLFLPDDRHTRAENRISIYAESGEMVFDRIIQGGESQITWNANQMIKPGTYIYRFNDSSGDYQTGKLIKLPN